MDCRGKKNRTLGVFQFDFIWVRLILSRKWETWWTLLRPKKIWGGFQGWMKKWREKRNKFCYLGVDWERWELKHLLELTGLNQFSTQFQWIFSIWFIFHFVIFSCDGWNIGSLFRTTIILKVVGHKKNHRQAEYWTQGHCMWSENATSAPRHAPPWKKNFYLTFLAPKWNGSLTFWSNTMLLRLASQWG